MLLGPFPNTKWFSPPFLHSCLEGPRLRIFTHGQSNPTYHVAFGDSQFVLRKKPPGKLLPSAHAIEREYKIIEAARLQGKSGGVRQGASGESMDAPGVGL